MATNYPASLDTFPDVDGNLDKMNDAGVEGGTLINNVMDAIGAVQTELGIDPAGSEATVAERLDGFEGPVDGEQYVRQSSGWTVVSDDYLDVLTMPGADDSAKLAAAATQVAAESFKRPLYLRGGRQWLFDAAAPAPYKGVKIVGGGHGASTEQPRAGNPYPTEVRITYAGTWLTFTERIDGFSIANLAIEGTANTVFMGRDVNTNYAAQVATGSMHNLGFSEFLGVFGTPSNKMLFTAFNTFGYWNINNAWGPQCNLGGSDNNFFVDGCLLDTPNRNVPYLLNCDYLSKTTIGPMFITAEGIPAAIRIDGGSTGDGLVFRGTRFEGRNAGLSSRGALVRMEGGKATFRDCWAAYAFTDPNNSGRSNEGGVFSILGGECFVDGVTYAYADTDGATVNTPLFYASGASSKLRVRNTIASDQAGGAWGSSLPKAVAANGAIINADATVDPGSGSEDLTSDEWLRWSGTAAQYTALSTSRKADPRYLFVETA